jgi:hypothetical protein
MDGNKWQSVLAVTPRRIECECGALAIFLAIFLILDERIGNDGEMSFRYNAFCQPCFAKDAEEQSNN